MKILLLLLLLQAEVIIAQHSNVVYRNTNDSSQNLYVVRPPKDLIRGLLVLNDQALSDSCKQIAYSLGIMTVTVVPTANSLDNFTSNTVLSRIDDMIGEVVTKYKIDKHKIIIGGMSVAGTGSIRYVQYCVSGQSRSLIEPIGVFGVDPPLDYQRLYRESDNAVKRHYNADSFEEGKILTAYLDKKLKGTPTSNLESYQLNSPYCYSANQGGKAYLLNDIAIRLYTEPDIDWWLMNRGKDYYDINASDNAALINQLRLNGNRNAELITTSNKGIREDGGRHPHSWSILDQRELLFWCDRLFSLQQR